MYLCTHICRERGRTQQLMNALINDLITHNNDTDTNDHANGMVAIMFNHSSMNDNNMNDTMAEDKHGAGKAEPEGGPDGG